MDIVTPERRSAMMSGIRGRDTKPEIAVRRLAHRLGYRFRLHRRDLPGTPDLVFPRRKKVIFVHGCFWHRHTDCRFAYEPKSNVEKWQRKFRANVTRDEHVRRELEEMDWDVLVIWECQTKDVEMLARELELFLTDADT
jgi:DNA mismatch endonuclease (patch repair protein)